MFLAWICFVATLGGFLFGFDTAVISGTVEFVERQFGLTRVELGWFGSAALVGCIIGAAVGGGLGDRYGRKPMLMVSGMLYFLSALYSAIPETFAVLAWARLIGGLGVGMASVLGPMYISEVAPARVRGRAAGLFQLSIAVGILVAYVSNYLLLQMAHSGTRVVEDLPLLNRLLIAEVWRGMFGAEMIPAALFTVLLATVPETPRWLARRGRYSDARRLLARLEGESVADTGLSEILHSLEAGPGSVRELFRPGLRTALILGVGLSLFGQLTGVNIVVYYGPMILRGVGLEIGSALLYQVLLGSIGLTFTVVAILKIDRWGRRPMLVWGMAFVTAAMGATAVLMVAQASAVWIVLALGLYMACLALSICGVIWVLIPEIFPNRLRGAGSSISTFVNWAANAFSAFAFPWYISHYGLGAGYFTFAAICLVATIFFWKLVPETKGKTLEEIERGWHEGAARTGSARRATARSAPGPGT